MSIIFMDSFDHYTTAAQALTKGWQIGPSHFSSSVKRTGTQSGQFQNGSIATLPVTIPDGTAIYLHFAIYSDNVSGNLCSSATDPASIAATQVSVAVMTNGALYAHLRGAVIAGTLTAPLTFRYNVWNYMQVKFVVSDTVGEVEVYLNGALVIDVNSKDTRYDGSLFTNAVMFGSNYSHYIDDLVISYNDADGINDGYLGDVRVACLLPQTDAVAAGSNADFTPSTGTDHGALVDEATPNDDTDYVSSSTLNHVDSWEFPALGYTGDIKGVQMSLRAKKSDSGTRAIAAVTKPAATNRVHATNHYLGMTDYVYWKAIWDQNPEDSAAWEVADVDGAEFGVKVTV